MTLATAFKVLQGKSFPDRGVSTCHAVIGILAALTTTIFRIVLLIISLNMAGNSFFVRLSPPEDIRDDMFCDSITIVEDSHSYTTWKKSKYEVTELYLPDYDYYNYNGRGGLYYLFSHTHYDPNPQDSLDVPGQKFLMGYTYHWFYFNTLRRETFDKISSNSYDQQGYQQMYFYCEDVTAYLNTDWIPVLMWFLLNILPQMLLSLIIMIITSKSKCFSVCCRNPVFILSGIFSHIQVGPVSYSKNTSGNICLSKIFSSLNILLTFIGMVGHIFLITVPFGAGDSSNVGIIMKIVIILPIFIISAFFNICFLYCFFCCQTQTETLVFNPCNPDKLHILSTDGTIVPMEEKLEMVSNNL